MLENIILALLGFWERVKEWYIKWFPSLAVAFAVLYAYGLFGSSDKGLLSTSDVPYIMLTVAWFTIFVMIYIVVLLKDKLNSKENDADE